MIKVINVDSAYYTFISIDMKKFPRYCYMFGRIFLQFPGSEDDCLYIGTSFSKYSFFFVLFFQYTQTFDISNSFRQWQTLNGFQL